MFDPNTTSAEIYFQVGAGALAISNSIEVLFLTMVTFQKYSTLYFYALVVCACGDILFTGGFIDLFFELYLEGSTIYRPLIVLTLGWYGMVTGFAVVMYSRLHLINVPKKYIQYVKYMICYNVVFSHFPTTVLTFGANVIGTPVWNNGYNTMEKIQVTFFYDSRNDIGFNVFTLDSKIDIKQKNHTTCSSNNVY